MKPIDPLPEDAAYVFRSFHINSFMLSRLKAYIEHGAIALAAFPDMLDALIEIESQLASHPEANTGNSKVHFAMCKARAAIAQARGER